MNRQSLNVFVVDRLIEIAQVAQVGDYLDSYKPPAGSGITLEAAVDAVPEVREAP